MKWSSQYVGPNRTTPFWWQKINPIYWISDEERNPDWPWLAWWWRNPLGNLNAVIIGVADKHRHWISKEGFINFADNGWQYAWTFVDGSWWPRWYISYRNKYIEVAQGWKTHGGFTFITLRRANSPNAGNYK